MPDTVHVLPPGVGPGIGDPNFIDQTGLDEINDREGLSDLIKARTYGYTFQPTSDLNALEAFSLNEQRNMLFGRGSENTLRDLANRVGAPERARQAREVASRGAEVDAGTFNRSTAGLDLSQRQKKLASRQLGLGRAIAEADAGTKSRRRSTDLAIGARRGLQQLEEGAFGQELGGLTQLANAAGQRRIREIAENADEGFNFLGLAGSIVGGIFGGPAGAAVGGSVGTEIGKG